jgi:Predicted nucleoside-diphosphate-sugar epimerases
MILITTASGHLGSAIIDFLLQKNTPASAIAGLARQPEKVKQKNIVIRKGDYLDYASLQNAFQGVDTLIFISSGSLPKRIEQHQNVVNAAKAAGVQHIIYTSVVKPSPNMKFIPGRDHFHTEEAIKKSGIAYTFMRNTFYADLLPAFVGGALQTGDWYYAAGDAKANFATRSDMAEAIANVALHTDEHRNAVYEITSNKAYTFHEIAQALNKATGKTVKYVPIPLSAMKDGMKQAGLPDADIALYTSVAESINEGELDITDKSLERLLQRKPVDLIDYLPALFNDSN